VDIPNTLYDPRKGHFVYHEYMDQLEYAEALGFDGIGRERAPPERLRAHALAQPHRGGALPPDLARGPSA